MNGYVPVAVTRRSGFDESLHWGAAVAIDAGGTIAWSVGDPELAVYPRSSTKPLLATGMVEAGLALRSEQLAVVCSSHDGSPSQIEQVLAILAAHGLDETSLGNTPSLPLDDAAAAEWIRSGGGPTPLAMNCSGKHAGMVATCVVNGWPIAGYTDPDHSLQRQLTSVVQRLAGPVPHAGVDGCGAVAHVMSLHALAEATAAVAVADGPVARSMLGHPDLVGGPSRFVSRLMRAVPGSVGKDGAEGVFAAAMPDGRAVAVKVADGAVRAVPGLVLAALAAVGVAVEPTSFVVPVLGHGRPVGEVRSLVGAP